MLPRSAVPISHDTRASRTHIFSDRHLIKLRFVQTQNLYRHCPRSALFISAREYIYQALAPCLCLCRMPAGLRPNKGRIEGVWSLSYASVRKPTTPLSRLLWLPPFGNSENLLTRSDGIGQRARLQQRAARLRGRVPRAGKERSPSVPNKSYADGEEPTIREIPQFTGGDYRRTGNAGRLPFGSLRKQTRYRHAEAEAPGKLQKGNLANIEGSS